METPKIEGIEFLGVTIKFEVPVDRYLYDLGSVQLECEGRKFVLDVCQSYTDEESTEIECELEVDTVTFPIYEYKYDLTAVDLMLGNAKGNLYIGEEYEEEPTSITLFIKHLNCTKAIELEIDK